MLINYQFSGNIIFYNKTNENPNTMIVFKQVTISNFLSYGKNKTTVKLDTSGTSLILGEDLDNSTSGVGANGVGKTVIANAITYAIYDKAISNITKDNLVNNINKKDMYVELEFVKDDVNYTIIRNRRINGTGSNNVILFENNVDVTRDSIANTNDAIQSIIGMPYELFVYIVVFNASNIPFFDLPSRDQSDMIEELFNLKILSDKADIIKSLIRETETKIEVKKSLIDRYKKEKENLDKQKASTGYKLDEWNLKKSSDIEMMTSKISELKSVNISEQRKYLKKLNDIDTLINEISTDSLKYEADIKHIRHSIEAKEFELIDLKDNICPYCKQTFSGTEDAISTLVVDISESKIKLNESIDMLKVASDQLYQIHENKSKLVPKIKIKNLEKLSELSKTIDNMVDRLDSLKNDINPYISVLDELNDIVIDVVDIDELNSLVDDLDHQKVLHKLLTKKDSFIRQSLINKYVPLLNSRVETYLTSMGLPHKVRFTVEMTAEISQFGRGIEFGNLSNGQKARINLALLFSFRDIIQHMHQPINICILDEILDIGLDANGVRAAASMIRQKANDDHLSLFIISHRNEVDGMFDRKLVVQMKNGFSSIVE